MPKRDAKTDPRPGGILRKGTKVRSVSRLISDGTESGWCCVEVQELRRDTFSAIMPSPVQWRKWAANAQVIHISGGAQC